MKWLHRLTYLYLLLPFIIFCLGWLRLVIALPIVLLMLWVVWKLWAIGSPKSSRSTPVGPDFSNRVQSQETLESLIPIIILTGLWVFLSGVGGYAFQNWDHHWRNAVFRDLITNDWPVVYSLPEHGPIKMLVYYVGYWLPAALTGKLFGWKFANLILFLWTWLGVLLMVLQLSIKLKTSLLKTMFLLVAFSGMDALGVILFAKEYPTLWPPVQHLEIWAGNLQYSSFTTQLFWVFNQSVPAWLCILTFVTLSEAKGLQHEQGDSSLPTPALPSRTGGLAARTVAGGAREERVAQNDMKNFIWALCFFFAPLASIGLLPYLLIDWFEQTRKKIKNPLQDIRVDLFFAGALIFIISYLFFSSTTAAQERGLQALDLKDVFVFFLLEGGILWLLLAPRLWRDPRWAVTGILLFIIPFIQLGSGHDFVMRASIAPLFYLMVWSGESLFQRDSLTTKTHLSFRERGRHVGARRQNLEGTKDKYSMLQIGLLVCLIIGALTPLYEINRSIYRTYEYYFLLSDEQRAQPSLEPATHLKQGGAPEAEHPGSLVADEIQTLTFMDDKLTKNFVANVRQSLYYHYLAPR